MIDRDIVLILVGGMIGALSSMVTLVLSYILEGMRLRRQWQREDQLLLNQKRTDIQNILAKTEQPRQPEGKQ